MANPRPTFPLTHCAPLHSAVDQSPREYSKNIFPPRMAPPLSTSVPAESSAWKTPLMALQSLQAAPLLCRLPTSAHGVWLTTPSSVFSRTLLPGWSRNCVHVRPMSTEGLIPLHGSHTLGTRPGAEGFPGLGSRRGLAEWNSTSWSPRPSAVRPLPRATHLFA